MMRAIVSVSRVWDVRIRGSICERDSGIDECKSISAFLAKQNIKSPKWSQEQWVPRSNTRY